MNPTEVGKEFSGHWKQYLPKVVAVAYVEYIKDDLREKIDSGNYDLEDTEHFRSILRDPDALNAYVANVFKSSFFQEDVIGWIRDYTFTNK